ncbi:MAG: hypothetical protein ACI8S6_000347 [Myxococcota bacterium]|jgi:hypothetical protein
MVSSSLLALLLGCTGYTYDTADPEAPRAGREVELGDQNNFQYTGVISLTEVAVAAQQDVQFSWPALSKDMQCHGVDPAADIDNIAVMVFPHLSPAEVEDGLTFDTLQQIDMGLYIEALTEGATELPLSALTFYGTDPKILKYTTAGSGTWLALLTSGTQLAVGTRALAFFTPTDGEENTTVSIGDSCDVLDFEADLESLVRVPVNVEGPWPVSWLELTVNGQRAPINLGKIDRVMLARYESLDRAALQGQFLDLELVADDLWMLELSGGAAAELGELTHTRTGAAFSGFTTEGTWLLALRCTTCPNPAPLFLTALHPLR